MKLEQRLENLIVKYRIDELNERYAKYLEAKKLLNQLVVDTKRLLIVADNSADADMVRRCINTDCTIDICGAKEYEAIAQYAEKCNRILVVTYEVKNEYRIRLNTVVRESRADTVFYLYDFFTEQGLVCEGEFYDVLQGKRIGLYGQKATKFVNQNYYEAIWRDKRKYLSAGDRKEKEYCLRKVIFDYLFIKDFVYAEVYINKYIEQHYTDYNLYMLFLAELKLLFEDMKKVTLDQRQHMIIFWLDALGKGEECGMPFLNCLEEKGMVFENAYTVTPTTSLTIKAMFLKKRFYQDAAYKVDVVKAKDSALIQYLQEKGYKFAYFGGEARFEDQLFGRFAGWNTPCSMMHWDLLCDMYETKQTKCYLIHDMSEMHRPFPSGLLEDFFYITDEKPVDNAERQERFVQRELGKYYVDKQLQFCQQFISEDNRQIIMSDHGGWDGEPLKGNGTHVNLILLGNKIKKCRIDRMFSYINFDMLIKYICELDEQILEKTLEEYVLVEFPDTYSRLFVELALQGRSISLSSFGWKGCVTQDDEFFVYTIGEEVYHVYPSWVNRVRLPECENRVQYLRQITGRKFDDVQKNPFFLYTRLLYQVWNNYINRTGGKERGVELLQKAVAQIAENKVIAVRGGGKHTSGVLAALGAAAARVKYIVDRNTVSDVHFEGPGLHLEVITTDEMQKRRIDVVIISSLPYRNEMKAELLETGIKYQIIDVYEMLEEEGIFLDRGFYQINLQQEDYVEVEIL